MDRDPRSHLRRLLEPIHDDSRAFARRLCRSTAEGDDVFHDSVVRALRKLDSLRDDDAFRSWFYSVIVNVHRTRNRRRLWRRLIPLSDRDASTASDPRDELESKDGAKRVREALASLSSVQREAIVLFELEGFLVEEIAAVQQVSTSAVKSRLARGRQKLRAIYIKRFGMSPVGTEARLAEGSTR